MQKTCFTCRHWKADPYKIVTGQCYRLEPIPKRANDYCIFWEAARAEFE